jgi:hypothetical protein
MRYLLILALMLLLLAPEAHAENDPVEAAKALALTELRDPGSARFATAAVLPGARNARGEPVKAVCGSISARNGFGGMSADSAFVVDLSDGTAYLTDPTIARTPYKAQVGGFVYNHLCLGH